MIPPWQHVSLLAGLADLTEAEWSLLLGSSPSFRPFQWGPQSRVKAPDNQCLVCFKSFSNRGSMTRHLRDQHLQPGATVTCDLCGKVCKNRNCLITHRSVAHSVRRRFRNFQQTHPHQELGSVSSSAEAALSKFIEMQQEINGQQQLTWDTHLSII